MIKIAVCDDDPMYLAGMQSYLQKWQSETGLPASVSAFSNADSLLEKAAQSPFDILFLDIIMPMLNGLDVARELRAADKSARIVFLTTSPEFALDSYSVKAADYLVKPATYERVKSVMNELSAEISQQPKSISIKFAGGYRRVYLNDIEYLEAYNKKVIFSLVSGEALETPDPLYVWEKALSGNVNLLKCHRSYLVNISNIDFFDSSVIHTKSGKAIPIARGYAKDFESSYFSAMFSE